MRFPQLAVFLVCALPLPSQVMQLSREQLIEYTAENPFGRSDDGRPRVPDDLMKRLERVSAEEVWTILDRHEYKNQYEGHWRILHPERRLIGRAVTAQFMPLRKDVQSVAEAKAAGSGPRRNANQRVIDGLQQGDTIVVDLYGKEQGGTYVGDNLAAAIHQFTGGGGFVVDGAVRDLGSILDQNIPGYIRSAHPTPIANCMLTGVNIPIRVGEATVMPGDVVFGDVEGVYFIPPKFVQEIVDNAEELRVHDEWTQMMLKTGKYRSSDIYPSPKDPALLEQYRNYKKEHLKR